MRVLVCGGRDYQDRSAVFGTLDALNGKIRITHVAVGGATGADRLGHEWSIANVVTRTVYPANWMTDGTRAGILRNARMLRDFKPDVVVAFPGGNGTAHMVSIAKKANVNILEVVT